MSRHHRGRGRARRGRNLSVRRGGIRKGQPEHRHPDAPSWLPPYKHQDYPAALGPRPHQGIYTFTQKDFMIVEGDMISEVNFFKLLDYHYINKSSFTLIVEEVPPKPKDAKLKAFQVDSSSERFTYVIEAGTNRLIGAVNPWDLKESGIKLKTSVLARHPNITFNSNLEQKGIVICNKGVARILKEFGDHFENFNEEFITFLSCNQYNTRLGQIYSDDVSTNESESISRYYKKLIINPKDMFRPFLYVTSEFSQRIRTVFDFIQVNLMRVPRSKEMAWSARTANDEEDIPIMIVRNQPAPPTENSASDIQTSQVQSITESTVDSKQEQAAPKGNQKKEPSENKSEPQAQKKEEKKKGKGTEKEQEGKKDGDSVAPEQKAEKVDKSQTKKEGQNQEAVPSESQKKSEVKKGKDEPKDTKPDEKKDQGAKKQPKQEGGTPKEAKPQGEAKQEGGQKGKEPQESKQQQKKDAAKDKK